MHFASFLYVHLLDLKCFCLLESRSRTPVNAILQIVGSIASIASIPLAVYLYLRSREANYRRLRADIVKTLSYQIGEGRTLSLFEVNVVIDSKLREYGVKEGDFATDEVIEDLVTEIISNPMLESSRKQEVIDNLRELHSTGATYTLAQQYQIGPSDVLLMLKHMGKNLKPEHEAVVMALKQASASLVEIGPIKKKTPPFEKLSTLFGVLAAILSVVVAILGHSGVEQLSKWVNDNKAAVNILLSVATTLVAAGLAIALELVLRRTRGLSPKEEQKGKRKEE